VEIMGWGSNYTQTVSLFTPTLVIWVGIWPWLQWMGNPYFNNGFGWNYYCVGGLDGTITIMVVDWVEDTTVLDTEFWIWWIWLEQCFYGLTIIMEVRIYSITPTMLVEEVQS
jgi:hypothetical protein